MGTAFAYELAGGEFTADREVAISIHLRHNHYPPVPEIMVPVCIEAIDRVNEGDVDSTIYLPDGVSWKGYVSCPVYAIIENFHLEAWLNNTEEGEA